MYLQLILQTTITRLTILHLAVQRNNYCSFLFHLFSEMPQEYANFAVSCSKLGHEGTLSETFMENEIKTFSPGRISVGLPATKPPPRKTGILYLAARAKLSQSKNKIQINSTRNSGKRLKTEVFSPEC